jgi:hypothetical protein
VPTGDAPRNAQADAQGAADGVWFHSVYDGSSTLVVPFFNSRRSLVVAPKQRRT